MRPTILIPLLLLCILITGCGQPITRAEWESHHPWTNAIDITNAMADDKAAGLTVLVYPDAIPHIDPVTGAYWREPGNHILRVRDGLVIERRWQRQLTP